MQLKFESVMNNNNNGSNNDILSVLTLGRYTLESINEKIIIKYDHKLTVSVNEQHMYIAVYEKLRENDHTNITRLLFYIR